MGSDITFGKTQQILKLYKAVALFQKTPAAPLEPLSQRSVKAKVKRWRSNVFQLLEKGKVIEKAAFRDNVLNATNNL